MFFLNMLSGICGMVLIGGHMSTALAWMLLFGKTYSSIDDDDDD